jgi:hypothetical protein
MPAPAKLVTLTQAKAHLNITIPPGDPADVEIQDMLNEAEETVLNYLKGAGGKAVDWVDPVTAPGPVTAAIKLLLGQLYQHRGDDEADGDAFWIRIDRLLARYHTPGVA